MKSIAYIIPYFGKFPNNFNIWLTSCKYNPTIDWLIFTDDKTPYDYPENVKVTYTEFSKIKERVQALYNFKISLKTPYKLCDFKPAYGEIFAKELDGYDFWGCCDIDLIFGNIRNFITDEILDNYLKIGFQGHSTLYLNSPEINVLYRTETANLPSYKTVYTDDKVYSFDEPIITKIFESRGIESFKGTVFAHLNPTVYNFSLRYVDKSITKLEKNMAFEWNNGELNMVYLENDQIKRKEFMYVHFFRRNMDIKVTDETNMKHLVIYPNVIDDKIVLNKENLKKVNKNYPVRFYINKFKEKRKKVSFFKMCTYPYRILKYKLLVVFHNKEK